MVLSLRPGQMARLDATFEPARDAALVSYAKRRFGPHAAVASEGPLRATVQQARLLAAGWGIQAEADVATVLDLCIMYGGQFGQADWASDVLQAPDRTGAQKAQALRDRVRRTVPGF